MRPSIRGLQRRSSDCVPAHGTAVGQGAKRLRLCLKERRSWGSGQELLYSHSCCSRLTSASCLPTPPTDAVLVAIKHRRVHASSTAGAPALAYGMNALPGLAPVHPAAMGSSGAP